MFGPNSSYANDAFWKCYKELPKGVQQTADRAFELFAKNPNHPSLHFKKVGQKQPIYSARVTQDYRALCYFKENTAYWFWIGNHNAYEKLISSI